jgi:hypothetical protein
MTGPASKHPPVADVAVSSAADPQYFEGQLWLMSTGSWEVHIKVTGANGSGELPVPVPAIALRTHPMQRGAGWFLFGMMLFLTAGLVAIVGAGVGEAELEPGVEAAAWNRKTLGWMAFTAVFLVGVLWFGKSWWADDAATYSQRIYKPLGITASLDDGDRLRLRITDPGWLPMRRLDDLVPDHGHLMHLFLLRWPAMDVVFHLHPEPAATGYFATTLPSLPAGHYRLYADIVHENGFSETAVGETNLPDVTGAPLTGDDAGGTLGGPQTMVWLHDPAQPVVARQVTLFTFAIEGPDGKPVNDLEPYMGMGGHAEFVKEDGSVFAHVHPTGSVPMASVQVASPEAMMAMHQTNVGPEVSFPYGIPTPGRYRIFVQMKRAGKVETGAFRLTVQ